MLLQGVPAVAVSLDNYKALTPEGFQAGAAYVVAFVKVSSSHACHVIPDRLLCSRSKSALIDMAGLGRPCFTSYVVCCHCIC